MLNKKNILIIIYLLLISTQVFSKIEDARNAYSNGNYLESFNLYNNWLDNNYQAKEFTSILLEISELSGDIFLLVETLENHIENVKERNTKKILYSRIAQMHELSSNLHKAQIFYQKSALVTFDEIDAYMLLKSAEILILEGNLFLAESQLNEIISDRSDQNILVRANILYTILNILNSKNNLDNTFEYSDNPESLYISYLIAKSNSKFAEMNKKEKQIIEKFESSPEAGLIKQKFHELPDILIAFGLLQEHSNLQTTIPVEETIQTEISYNYSIQTGSFRDKENAHYLSKDLQETGFSTTIEEQIINNIKYYKVILYLSTVEELEKTLIKLKEKGFDGFPIY